MTRRQAKRLVGTMVMTIPTGLVLGMGLWTLGAALLATWHPVIAIPALLGLAAAPFALVWDIVQVVVEKGEKTPE